MTSRSGRRARQRRHKRYAVTKAVRSIYDGLTGNQWLGMRNHQRALEIDRLQERLRRHDAEKTITP